MEITEKLSVVTDEISQNFEKVLKLTSSYDIKAVDLRTVWKKNVALLTNEELEKIKSICDKYDTKINVITSPFGKCLLPNARLASKTRKSLWRNPEYNLSLFDRIVEIADFLNTPNIRIFSFFIKGIKLTEEKWNEVITLLKPYVKKAEALNKTLLLENDYGLSVSTIDTTEKFFSDIKSPAVKLLLDPGNYYMAGEPTTPEAYEYFYEHDLVKHMHVKDPKKMIPGIRALFTVVEEGRINYLSLFEQALKHNFEGYFCLETHAITNKYKTSKRSLENMTVLLKQIQ